jgi:hypothetical protein
MDSKEKSCVQENLLNLYLRLNGYFVSGVIVHSPIIGKATTEVDVLAIRFPHNSEPERLVEPDNALSVSAQDIDLVICEVKSKGQTLQFNKALYGSVDSVKSLLRWAGIHTAIEIEDLAPKVSTMLQPNSTYTDIPCVQGPRRTRIRGLMCCPERDKIHSNQPFFISGSALFEYISKCLCPETPRASCSTKYDYGLWGEHENIVRYFKGRGFNNQGTIDDLYEYLSSAL